MLKYLIILISALCISCASTAYTTTGTVYTGILSDLITNPKGGFTATFTTKDNQQVRVIKPYGYVKYPPAVIFGSCYTITFYRIKDDFLNFDQTDWHILPVNGSCQ